MYWAIKGLYSNTECSIVINGLQTQWFRSKCGVRQVYINDLAVSLKNLNLGISVDDLVLSLLLYADDIILLSENIDDLNSMTNIINEWCNRWRVGVNYDKSKIVHFRKRNVPQSDHIIRMGGNNLQYISSYKYLGVIFDGFLTFDEYSENRNIKRSVISHNGNRSILKSGVCPLSILNNAISSIDSLYY